MLICTSKTLKQFIPDAEFFVASRHPKFDSQRGMKYGLRFFNSNYSRLNVNMLLPLLCTLRELAKTDLVIDLSGFSFTDRFGKLQAVIPSFNIFLCKLLRKRIVMFSQAVGPFRSRANRLLARLFLRRTDLIVVRGETTRGYLREIGIDKQVHVYADSAFLLKPAPVERVNEILQKESIEKDERELVIGISVNARIYERSDTLESENRYLKLVAQIADYLVEKLNARVVFVPNEITQDGFDDKFVAGKIYKIVRNKSRIKLIENEYSPDELKAMIGIFDLFIGSRFHSIIASTSMIVPTIAIAWSHKYYETMETLGQEKYVCHFKTVSLRQLRFLIEDALSRREEIKKVLKVRVEKAKQSAFEGVKLVSDLFFKV